MNDKGQTFLVEHFQFPHQRLALVLAINDVIHEVNVIDKVPDGHFDKRH